MATLRKKLEQGPDAPQYIQTHIGVGYRILGMPAEEKETLDRVEPEKIHENRW